VSGRAPPHLLLPGWACALALLSHAPEGSAWPRHTLIAPQSDQCFTEGRVLPAGVFYRTIGWGEAQFPDCPTPTVALLARAHVDAREATAAIRSLRGRGLAPGYPWAVAEPYVGVAGSGIAVVVGLFATTADAEAWRARLPDVPLTLAPLLGEREALAAVQTLQRGQVRRVVQIVAPAPVPAYSAADVARPSASDQRPRAALRPRCTVAPDTVFESGEAITYTRDWEPVRCGGVTAFVRRSATNAEAVVWRGYDGHPRITQVTEVACDCPIHTTWTLVGRRRTRPEETTPCPGGC
jgi:hypothetical protein